MGNLYDARLKIEKVINEKKLDAVKTKGQIGLKAGLMIALINQNTPDDNDKLQKLAVAVKEVLRISL